MEKAPPLLTAVLIGDGIDPAVHMELAPVQGQLADVQVLSGNDQRSTLVDMMMPVSSNRSTSSTPETVSRSRPISSRRWPAWDMALL